MEKLLSSYTLVDCLDKTFTCDCGKEHTSALAAAEISEGAIAKLPDYMKKFNWQKPYLICDKITYDIAGKKVEETLAAAGYKFTTHIITHTAFDEATLGEITVFDEHDTDVIFGVGTGAINDMCRYYAYKVYKPYACIATAAPMDGFASANSSLLVNNMKMTYEVAMPKFIVGDVDILKNAPDKMIAAGLGDLIGKYTCLCDWKLSKVINNEHYCDTIVTMVENNISTVLAGADKAKDRDPKVIGDIMTGLVLTGVCMGMYGNSRPASGCEHHLSHFWEMWFEQRGLRAVPHGIQVGVGCTLILMLTEALRAKKIDFNKAREFAKAYDENQWKKEIETVYGPAANGIIEMEAKAKKNETTGHLARIDSIEKNWNEILKLLNELPSSEKVAEILKSLNSSSKPEEIGVDKDLLKQTLKYAKETRARYSILQLIWDLGLLDECIDDVVNKL